MNEGADDYPYVVAMLSDRVRVIECDTDIQWIVQARDKGRPRWRSFWYCRTKAALGHGDHPAIAALPERYIERRIRRGVGGPVGSERETPLEATEQPATSENARSQASGVQFRESA